MEVNDGNIQALAGYLEKTLSPDISERRPAEKFLESVESNKNYPLLLLHLVDKNDAVLPIRTSAAITFKNYIKRNWRIVEEAGDKIHAEDRLSIKQLIVGLMLKSPEQIQKQLSNAITTIGQEDFPEKWTDLLSQMVDKFKEGDFHIINGVLRTAHSIFKRYRHEFKSEKLWKEIKFVLDNFAAPLTQLFDATIKLAETHASDPVALKIIFSSLTVICKLFYSLNFQDLPEYFEDNMGTWMAHFHTLLTTDNKLLKTEDEEEAGLLEQLKSQICDNVALYAQKYDEEFSPHLPNFVTATWHLLVTTNAQPKYDLLVSNAIQFLASVAERPGYTNLFEDPATLQSICEKVVVPNMQFRTSDEELFQDNPEEYIRRDIEGSDIDTRRRAACDLVRALCKSFEGPVIQNFSQYVQAMLIEYSKDPVSNWKSKDVAIYLVTSLASKASTQKHGTTQTSQLVNLADFFNSQILPDLQNNNVNELSILKADAIKYVMTFRNQLSKDMLIPCVPLLVKLLTSSSTVVHSYAAVCLDKLFTLRSPQGPPLITREDIQSSTEVLLTNLFGALDLPGSQENEYIMKGVMRTFSLLQDYIVPYISVLMAKLGDKLVTVSKNPSKPHFNHYLFESICIAIRATCKANPEAVDTFELGFFPPFQEILQLDVQEFIPYIFQILSLLLEIHTHSIPQPYMELFGHLLTPVLWERPGNIPPLVRLLQGFIEKGARQIAQDKIPDGLLGVFQKLNASKTNDHQGFYILSSLVENVPSEVLQPQIKQIFLLLFQRLSSSKTTKYIKSLIVFFSVYAIKFGGSVLIQLIDSIQAKMFGMVLEKVFIAEVQKVGGRTERKICAVGLTKILTETPEMLTTYQQFWTPLLQALIAVFELPEDDSTPDCEHFIDVEDTPGYQTAYSQLLFAGKKEFNDPLAGAVADPKIYLAQRLGTLSAAHPAKLGPMIRTGLPAEAATFLENYIQAAGVKIS